MEIIRAEGLPIKDNILAGGGYKSDPFVALVFEDCIAKTDVIPSCLSPWWMPWTQRAFIFRRMHVSSNLHIGVFDHDEGITGGDDDICGKVSVDLANLRSNTEYLLTYNLYENSVLIGREAKGTITIRLRMENRAERRLILSNLRMPPKLYVNVKHAKDFNLM